MAYQRLPIWFSPLKEGLGSNVTNGCCWVSREDVCGDDHVRVVSAISISIYYRYLLSVRVDGSGVNPRASICFNASTKTRFAGKKRLIALLRMIWLYFVLLIGEGALRKWIVIARCSVACNSRSS